MSLLETSITKALGLRVPLIVAPMAGGPTTSKLVGAASEAGALGSLGASYSQPNVIGEMSRQVRSITSKPFAINLFIPNKIPKISDDVIKLAILKTQRFRDQLKIPVPTLTPPYEEDFGQQFEEVLRIKPKILSFIFGVLPPEFVKEARDQKLFLIGTATTLDEAYQLQENGVHAIVAQGVEAGGHRGLFDPFAADPAIKTRDLVKSIKAKITIPVIAAGGIMSSSDIKEMLSLGAEAVQMGTAFLATQEAGTSTPYRNKLLELPERRTKTTRAFSGRLARGMVNRFMTEMDSQSEVILPYPIQNKFTRDLRTASAAVGSADFLSLWSGCGKGDLWIGSAADLIRFLFS